ncbi:MAG TPA: nitrate/nitrite transporter NrtS [Alphaproteobacteria bacterium]|nr:nitrate/nitrite transporter NrtS [Alphaproteobacteria bacterium]
MSSTMSRTLNQMSAPPLSQMIFADKTPKKAFLTALVVGTILTMINHGDVFLAGGAPPLLKVVLTYCVPYCVTTWGAIMGKRAQWLRDQNN